MKNGTSQALQDEIMKKENEIVIFETEEQTDQIICECGK